MASPSRFVLCAENLDQLITKPVAPLHHPEVPKSQDRQRGYKPNEGANIKDLLDCLILEYPKASIIVSDDGSKDETREVVSSFNNKVYFLFNV